VILSYLLQMDQKCKEHMKVSWRWYCVCPQWCFALWEDDSRLIYVSWVSRKFLETKWRRSRSLTELWIHLASWSLASKFQSLVCFRGT
jgi:hypothetical protein